LRLAKDITRWLATGVAVIAVSLPCVAQRYAYHPSAARAQASSHSAPSQPPRNQPAPRSQQAPRQPQRHAGDWLRQYKDLPPGEQDRALQNDAHFRSLPPTQQQQLRRQLRYFSNLPPQQQEHILRLIERGAKWGGLTPEQRQRALQVHRQMQMLPPDRQRMVRSAIRDLRAMPPAQREQVIDSDRFRSNFSPQELGILHDVTRLPLAPAEGGAEAPPQE
jgi:phage-related protein